MRLPLIFGLIVVGCLFGGRWMREMRINHSLHRMAIEERKLEGEIQELNRDITDLRATFTSLVTRDAVDSELRKRNITMHKIPRKSAIELAESPTPSKGGKR